MLQDGNALQHASEEMKNNEAIVTAAVQQNVAALKYASEEMKNNEPIVMVAVLQDGNALEHASEEMNNNEAIVIAALQLLMIRRYSRDWIRNVFRRWGISARLIDLAFPS